ncbi:MAG: DUF4493 domain-containing protein [Muribaculum sp.]|nr:DUF4493 domain-containing protein [Muribaculum sp.]
MKTNISYLLTGVVGIASVCGLAACTSETPYDGEEMGTVYLRTTINSIITRADESTVQDNLAENCVVSLYRTDGGEEKEGLIYQVKGLNNLAESLRLAKGNYRAEAWTGIYKYATFASSDLNDEYRYFLATENFQITRQGDNQTVTLDCKIQNVAVSIDTKSIWTQSGETETAANLLDYMKDDYEITIGTTKKTLTFNKENAEYAIAYFMMPEGEDYLTYTIRGHRADAKDDDDMFTKTGKLENVVPSYHYKLKFSYNPGSNDSNEVGGVSSITINIDKGTNMADPVDVDVNASSKPIITLIDYDYTTSLDFSDEKNIPNQLIAMINANGNSLKTVNIKIDGHGESSYNLPNDKSVAKNTGIIWEEPIYDETTKICTAFVFFDKELIKGLSMGSVHKIDITAIDNNSESSTATISIQR